MYYQRMYDREYITTVNRFLSLAEERWGAEVAETLRAPFEQIVEAIMIVDEVEFEPDEGPPKRVVRGEGP